MDAAIIGLLLFFVGTITGSLSGILGIGGGLLMVPALTLVNAQWSLVQVTATSLIGVFLSAVSGSLRNLKAGELNWQASLGLAIPGIITAFLGADLGDRISDQLLAFGFAALLLVAIYLMGLRKQLAKQQAGNIHHDSESAANDEHNETRKPEAFRPMPVVSIGLTAGILSGLFGVGGGVVMVPLQMLILAEPIKAAVRTSLGAIVAIAASGLVRHTFNNNVQWIPGLCLGIGGIIGAQFGSRLLPKLPDRWVNRIFRLLLIALAVYMVIRAIAQF